MTSAYETTEREEQKATSLHDTARVFFNPDATSDVEKTSSSSSSSSSSRASFATGDSSFEESTLFSSVEVSVLSASESFDGDLGIFEKEKENKDEGSVSISVNLVNNISQMNRFENGELSFEDNERHKEKKSVLLTDYIASENASTCSVRREQDKDQKNRSILKIHMQEQRDSSVHPEEKFRDSAMEDAVRVCYENMVEICLNTDEKQDEFEREIISQQDSDSFYDAVRSGNAKRVSMLIANGCVQNLDEPDWNVSGDPPLLMAATNHCFPVLSALLANGCDPAVRSPRGETALHRVILNGGPGNVLKFVEDLLKYDCPPGVKEAGSGSTALHVLSRQLAHTSLKSLRHNFDVALKTLELLAKAGPVNAKDHQGRSALHILASSTIFDNNHKTDIESLIGTLLAAGADTALKNDRGETALHESLECGALNTATLLIQHTPTGITSRYGETPLHIASRKNHVDMVTKLLEHGEDPGTQDAGGNTPLHLASARGFHQTVSLLVTSPLAQLEKDNVDGLTALQVAAESGFANAVRILLKAGADPSQTMHYCATILRRHPDISLLIDHELTRRRQLAA
ncbi:Ankyrin-2 [Trachymyrmex septentrionalis]|uniref:Ankyrin-2 n=1 Tax=Trachymyrmex septentrionalis TaxID=34720 RepID=A0A151JXB8_9HYME|nr:PREDICTED: ankyrin-1-like [Trachymyrmex septentrionalis]KYN39416.1 Ankyrin-2 [Trachymyrmex septentrionalis]